MARLDYTSTYPKAYYKATKIRALIQEFLDSGADSAEVIYAEGEYNGTDSCAGSLAGAISKLRCKNIVKAKQLAGHVWLVRVDGD